MSEDRLPTMAYINGQPTITSTQMVPQTMMRSDNEHSRLPVNPWVGDVAVPVQPSVPMDHSAIHPSYPSQYWDGRNRMVPRQVGTILGQEMVQGSLAGLNSYITTAPFFPASADGLHGTSVRILWWKCCLFVVRMSFSVTFHSSSRCLRDRCTRPTQWLKCQAQMLQRTTPPS